ncbi:M90 family metallopeptidase [Shewanella sp. GXUN23E]|uniref:M90 family metallopeptidase n=1 Tax=Shewanella sp. GXUN23E TaxID=3422498 RepID=UPI003D7DFFBA
MLAILLVSLIGLTAILWLASAPLRIRKKREKVRRMPFPKSWRDIIRQRLPMFRSLPADLQLQLKDHIKIFLAEKQFVGCDGLEINDDIRVTIAAQACVLLLNRDTDYFPKLRQILVYPAAFIVDKEQRNEIGLSFQHRAVLLGESWDEGQVILSWHDALAGAADPHDGSNVVMHEFAHQLDQEDGRANGAPPLATQADYASWSEIMNREFAQLQYCAQQELPSLFSYYGATNPAEFFAVITEVFFEQPQAFNEQHPLLYRELSHFYRLDPLTW